MTRHEQTILLRVVALVLAVCCLLAWATCESDTGFLVDQYTKGSKRYCVYDVLGDTVVITVDYQDLCPIVLEV